MSDERLSRAIAEFLEPMPAKIVGHLHDFGITWSSEGFWFHDCVEHDDGVFAPRDFVNNSAMTVLLMVKLLERGANICGANCPHIGGRWADVAVDYGATTLDSVQLPVEQIGRAVALAFCAAHGLKVN